MNSLLFERFLPKSLNLESLEMDHFEANAKNVARILEEFNLENTYTSWEFSKLVATITKYFGKRRNKHNSNLSSSKSNDGCKMEVDSNHNNNFSSEDSSTY